MPKPSLTLPEWVEQMGGRIRVARLLGVTPQAVHYWLTGHSTPEWKTIFKIIELSRGQVTTAEIFATTKVRERAGRSKLATRMKQ